MNIMLLGAGGFIGTNLALALSRESGDCVTVVSRRAEPIPGEDRPGLRFLGVELNADTDFDTLLRGQNVVYHLLSTTMPSTSNRQIARELEANVVLSANLLEACARQGVERVVFFSSGGTVYGKSGRCPFREDAPTEPITSYGVQKLAIEKLLFLYRHMYGLDYRIIRLANPYGPWQRPNGQLGAVTTFVYKALAGEPIEIYGDGHVVRDFLYIDDAVRGVLNIARGESEHRLFNLGSGTGTSIRDILGTVERTLGVSPEVRYTPARAVDVPANYLDISRYETAYGPLDPIPLEEGILRTAAFLRKRYSL